MLSDILNAASTDFVEPLVAPTTDMGPVTELTEDDTSDDTSDSTHSEAGTAVSESATTATSTTTTTRPLPYVPIRRTRVRWTSEESESIVAGLRKHGRDYSAICNDKTLALNACRRITDVRERIRCLYKNGLLPEDCRLIFMQTPRRGRKPRLFPLLGAGADGGANDGVEFRGAIVDIRRGSYDEPVVRMFVDGGESGMTGWTSTTHMPKSTVRAMLAEFVERTSSRLRIALELVASLERRPEEPIGEHAVASSRPTSPTTTLTATRTLADFMNPDLPDAIAGVAGVDHDADHDMAGDAEVAMIEGNIVLVDNQEPDVTGDFDQPATPTYSIQPLEPADNNGEQKQSSEDENEIVDVVNMDSHIPMDIDSGSKSGAQTQEDNVVIESTETATCKAAKVAADMEKENIPQPIMIDQGDDNPFITQQPNSLPVHILDDAEYLVTNAESPVHAQPKPNPEYPVHAQPKPSLDDLVAMRRQQILSGKH